MNPACYALCLLFMRMWKPRLLCSCTELLPEYLTNYRPESPDCANPYLTVVQPLSSLLVVKPHGAYLIVVLPPMW